MQLMAQPTWLVICNSCKRGRLVQRRERLSFQQWTDRGRVACEVEIDMLVCDGCGAKTWDDAAEAMIEEAMRREYRKLR